MEARPTIHVCSLSGGKDSQAVAAILHRRYSTGEVRYVMADTGFEHPVTIEHATVYLPQVLRAPVELLKADFSEQIARRRLYVEQVWPTKGVPDNFVRRALTALHPTGIPFLDLCLWKGRFPSRTRQFCTQFLKRHVLDGYLANLWIGGYRPESWRGIRRSESENRRNAPKREVQAEGWTIRNPIAAWSAHQVVHFVTRTVGWKLNPLYSQGMSRVGCFPCINCSKAELFEIARRFPWAIDRIREWEELASAASRLGYTTFFHTDDDLSGLTSAEIFERCRIDQRVKWAMTSRGGRQYDMLKLAPPEQCSSMYGLCE